MQFIKPAQPKLRARPPSATAGCMKSKFDGYRIQLHKFTNTVLFYGEGGYDFRRKFLELADALSELPRRVLCRRRTRHMTANRQSHVIATRTLSGVSSRI